jgi:hypothetical protein
MSTITGPAPGRGRTAGRRLNIGALAVAGTLLAVLAPARPALSGTGAPRSAASRRSGPVISQVPSLRRCWSAAAPRPAQPAKRR